MYSTRAHGRGSIGSFFPTVGVSQSPISKFRRAFTNYVDGKQTKLITSNGTVAYRMKADWVIFK